MTARRRRGGSESEQAPFVVTGGASYANSGSGTIPGYQQLSHNVFETSTSLGLESSSGNGTVPAFNPTMTSRDRTNEFASAVRSLQGRQIIHASQARDPRKARHIQSYAEFMMIARTIGKNISSTYSKLEKLTLRMYSVFFSVVNCLKRLIVTNLISYLISVAKRKSLFNDRPTEIQELTYIIKEDLSSLNGQIARLQEVARNQRRSQQTGRAHLLSHSSSVVLALQSKLASMSSEFKSVLEVRTEVWSIEHKFSLV